MNHHQKLRTTPTIKVSRYRWECCFVIVKFNVLLARGRVNFNVNLSVSFLRERAIISLINYNKFGFGGLIIFKCFIFHSLTSHKKKKSHNESSFMYSNNSINAMKSLNARSNIFERVDDTVRCFDVVE